VNVAFNLTLTATPREDGHCGNNKPANPYTDTRESRHGAAAQVDTVSKPELKVHLDSALETRMS